MLQYDKIPIIVGVTGHRNLVEEDKPFIKAQVIESLKEIRSLCKGSKDGEETPVVMLNAFAQGSDMLCAEAAFELGIDVYAVLPCEEERYIDSFDDEVDRAKLNNYLGKAKRKFISPDVEKNKDWLKNAINISDDSYEYRQLGIYVAEHSHILLALWDGKPPKTQYGCGTVEVIQFALKNNYLNKDHLFKPGFTNESAVVWIKSRRQGDGTEADIKKKWLISKASGYEKGTSYGDFIVLDNVPDFLENIINKTVEYNREDVDVSSGGVRLWKQIDELDEYRKNLRLNYIKADALSYGKNQKQYNLFILLLAVLGTVVACTFLIYDEATLPFMILPCTFTICFLLFMGSRGKRKGYHKKYIEYRAMAEALRIQFYSSMCLKECPVESNVCELCSWAQKEDIVWINKAIQALSVTSKAEELKVQLSDVIDVWIGMSDSPKGQLKYHNAKKTSNKKQAEKLALLSKIASTATIGVYFVIFLLEIITFILQLNQAQFFWGGQAIKHVTWRNIGAIVLGVCTSASLLFSSYWGKLSYSRKADDNVKMSHFYASAYERWNEVKIHPEAEIEKFVKEIAREEIVENGIWCSYVSENGLEITI